MQGGEGKKRNTQQRFKNGTTVFVEGKKLKGRELEKKGNFSPERAAELLKAAADLKDLLDARLQAEAELKK